MAVDRLPLQVWLVAARLNNNGKEGRRWERANEKEIQLFLCIRLLRHLEGEYHEASTSIGLLSNLGVGQIRK